MNYWKFQRDLDLSALEKRAPRCAETIRRLDAADEELAAALLFGATEPGRTRDDVVDRLCSAQKCLDEDINVLLLLHELCG